MNTASIHTPSDSELVERIRNGETQDFGQIVKRYANVLTAIASSRLKNPEEARDIVQEALVIAYCSIAKLESGESLAAWLRGIVVNQCNKLVDRKRRYQRFIERLPHPVKAEDPHEIALHKERTHQIQQCLNRLPESRREVVALFYFQDASIPEIADLMSKPEGTIKRILSESRAILKEDLIEMARQDFTEYQLTDEQRRRLERIPQFPLVEPKITTSPTDTKAEPLRTQSTYGNFAKLEPGAEAFFADYDHPFHGLVSLSHVIVQGPFEVENQQALRFDCWSFTKDGRAEGIWRPYYTQNGDDVIYCAKQFGQTETAAQIITPTHPDWGEPQPSSESLILTPGENVDSHLWSVKIGHRVSSCLRRVTTQEDQLATEEFFLEDGRLLLWRRYNGPSWKTTQNGDFKKLQQAKTPTITKDDVTFHLWYDQLPDYAL